MSKRIPRETLIGGTNREELLPNLGAPAADNGVSLEWRGANNWPETVEDLWAARKDHDAARPLWLRDHRANDGRSCTLEEFLDREQFASDDDGRPLIPFTTMMLMAQAVD